MAPPEPDAFVLKNVANKQNDADKDSPTSMSNLENSHHSQSEESSGDTFVPAEDESNAKMDDADQVEESQPELAVVDDNDDEERSVKRPELMPSDVQPVSFSDRPLDDSDDADEGISLPDRRTTTVY